MSEVTFKQWYANPKSRKAFERWYSERNPSLFMQAYKITGGNKSLSEDLLHDVMIQFIDRQDVTRMRSESATLGYIMTSVRNRWRDYLRHENRGESLDDVEELRSTDTPIDLALMDERLENIEKTLSSNEKETFRRMLEGKNLKEIAAEESIEYSNAGVRVHRIRNKIKELIDL